MNEFHPNILTNDAKKSMRTRIITGTILALVVLPCIFLGEWFFLAIALVAEVLATIEIVRCAKRKYSPLLYIVSILLVVALSLWPIIRTIGSTPSKSFRIFLHFDQLYLSIIILFASLCIVLFMVLIDKNFAIRDATYIFTFLLILSLGIQSALFLRSIPSYKNYINAGKVLNPSYFNFYDSFESSSLFIYVAIGTFATDIGAYFIGVFFGKNKMNERISPKKTWEGFIGGIVISTICSFLFGFILAKCKHPMLNMFTINKWYIILILSFVMPFFSTLGDFVFSSAKRYYEIKDYGSVLPGHGGVMDRIDSFIFTLITSAVVINIVTLIESGNGLSSLI